MLTHLIVERMLADAEAERQRERRRAALARDALGARRSTAVPFRVRVGKALIRVGQALATL